jgi:hypothetical protein
VPSKTQQCRMEADCLATTFQHRALQIVVQQDTRNAIPPLKIPLKSQTGPKTFAKRG